MPPRSRIRFWMPSRWKRQPFESPCWICSRLRFSRRRPTYHPKGHGSSTHIHQQKVDNPREKNIPFLASFGTDFLQKGAESFTPILIEGLDDIATPRIASCSVDAVTERHADQAEAEMVRQISCAFEMDGQDRVHMWVRPESQHFC